MIFMGAFLPMATVCNPNAIATSLGLRGPDDEFPAGRVSDATPGAATPQGLRGVVEVTALPVARSSGATYARNVELAVMGSQIVADPLEAAWRGRP
jgi:hypothetical protein